MDIKSKRKTIVVFSLVIVMIITSGCLPTTFQKEIEKTEQENEKTKQEIQQENPVPSQVDAAPNDVELSPEQIKALEDIKQTTPEEALLKNDLDKRVEVGKDVPIESTLYTDKNEFSRYVSHLFYLYHTKQIEPVNFHKKLAPHFHESFKELLPDSTKNQIRTFELLQEQFLIHLPSPIIDYTITNIETNPRTSESSFYRMYTLNNKQKVYYMTVFQQSPVNGQWLLVDDKPAPPYDIQKVEEKSKAGEDSKN